MAESTPHVVILGGGFGGLYAAKALRNAPVRVTVVDKRNHHLFQPLLYQVATAALSAPDIAAPIRNILRKQKNTTVLMARADRIDVEGRALCLSDGRHAYDHLIVAAGMRNHYFGHDEWAVHAPGLKTLTDAFDIRRRVLLAYEAAENETDDARRRELLTFVVIGGGPTGVKLAGALSEIAQRTMARNFRHFDPRAARVMLVEGGDKVLGGYPEDLPERALEQMRKLGIEVRFGKFVTDVTADSLTIGDEVVRAGTILWAAGIRGADVAESLGIERDRMGRVPVEPDLSIPGHPEVYVIGDLAHFEQDGSTLPGVAPVAIQMGRCAASNILRRAEGQSSEPFHYFDKGSMATIGRSKAVAYSGKLRFSGFIAWLMWLFIHIVFLIGFRSRIMVMMEWAFAYITYQRSARVILERPIPLAGQAAAPAKAEADVRASAE